MTRHCLAALLPIVLASFSTAWAEERTQSFDKDPGWDGRNYRSNVPEPQLVRQDFGFSATGHAGGESAGEMGGYFTPAAEPAYYAKPIAPATFDSKLTASGKLRCRDRQFHVLLGFFNDSSVNEWRVPNSLFIRLNGRGEVFYAYVEYATSRWRAGADTPGGFSLVTDPNTGKGEPKGFATGDAVHTWSLTYDPAGNGGKGSVTATIDAETSICHLDPGHKEDGATFNRFGALSIPKSFDTGGEVWFDDITVNGAREDFRADPRWESVGNRRTYTTTGLRPRFDFGFTPTNYAGGKSSGELGGIVFRGDCREPAKLAYYGDRLEPITLKKPIRASGRIALRRGVSDSTSLIGFFDSKASTAVSDSQASGLPMNFLGIAIEGPSREGFLVYPAYRFPDGADGYARGNDLPHILPDGRSSDWSFEYDPAASGRITVRYGKQSVKLDLGPDHARAPARFDRFGIVTTWIDGNAQNIYFDDLTYTFRQD